MRGRVARAAGLVLVVVAVSACGLQVVGGASADAGIAVEAGGPGAGEAGGPDALDSAPGPFAPSKLPGSALWLVADNAVVDPSGSVRRWIDASGLGNDAVPVASSAPVVVAAAINEHAVVRFDGVRSFLTIPSNPALEFGGAVPNPFALAVVVRYPAPTSDSRALFAKLGTAAIGPLLLVQGGSAAGTTFSAQVAPEKGSGAFARFTELTGTTRVLVQWTPAPGQPGGTLSVRVGRGPASSTALSRTTTLGSSSPAYIGAADFGTGADMFVAADIAEVVLWSPPGAIDPADVAKVETYLDGKYAL